jgi:hypothetical protein
MGKVYEAKKQRLRQEAAERKRLNEKELMMLNAKKRPQTGAMPVE